MHIFNQNMKTMFEQNYNFHDESQQSEDPHIFFFVRVNTGKSKADVATSLEEEANATSQTAATYESSKDYCN